MSRRIQILPDAVANQIAAGEAVERPASAVKELVENALDACATRVEVAIERGGKRRIRVSDDGMGMGREDALLCLDRHATSKIQSADDLAGVPTFGFRGEAMPSIASVSRMSIETFDGDGEAGTRVEVHAGGISSVSDFPRRRGTTVEVRNLFYNAPVRARFLKSVSAETRAANEVVTALALANPGVAFLLTSDDRVLLDLPAAEAASGRIAQVWGLEHAGTLIPTSGGEDGLHLVGLIQRPDQARPGVRRSHLFVNGRPFRSPALVRAVERGYRTTIPQGVRPWLFLYLQVPGNQVDVNVHPAKSEVRFRDQNRVEGLIEQAVRTSLDDEASSATFDRPLGAPPMAVREVGAGQGGAAPPSAVDPQMALFVPASDDPEGSETDDSLAGSHAVSHDGTAVLRTARAQPLPEPGARKPRLWQVLDTYVFAETRDGVLIVDQHAAHERILFQRLMDGFEAGGQESQRLLFPLTLKLTAPEVAMIEDLGGLLSRAGFEVEGFGGDTVIVHAVPNPHRYFDAERAFREMIHELTHGSDLVRSARNQHERIASTFACKSAIKAGQKLSEAEMQELFDQLFATELPHHDVHGRPTIVRLSGAELERKFGRT
ncbi:MAG: DNA mismatch repair endonuclease MutL [Gemmatimonadota bacterium]|nr:DNA mismatch repair endonuclease MutL [Gemmatimonadota bacterium]MDE3004781.1 DNA mismatch repair endonuclease MutL [Gemmatimonadota bacterium]MDE3014483.1 DNA mismatch repair endonuclease MutL [Gemmatimonadota bacterium]